MTLLSVARRSFCSRQSLLHTNAVNFKFVPPSSQPLQDDIDKLHQFVSESSKLLILTGAGASTESGIPDYRSEGVGLYARSTSRPVQYQSFVKSYAIKQRYWARNFIGWPQFSSFLPSNVHQTLSDWERMGIVHWLITQNVDALHLKAGSKKVTELHGSLHRVECMSCKNVIPRTEYQKELVQVNPDFRIESVAVNPDGDVDLTQEQIDSFKMVPCGSCGGHMKPQIVFFGDNVKKDVVDSLYDKVKSCDKILVAGSSLEVFSGYRFVNRASEYGKPIAIVNIGPTRADHLATLKINARCGHVLPHINLKS